ncbi:hypothetical protein T552_02112 [Pneumocystis carinii B80]|uniref:RNA polymerase II-associated protein 1 C-terminal domain-containing protein n=1 Tax=Pneumocystis carinii (strain B80) TaxID=1408658 RepID=A0A0W4ZH17_PNEC8|nr:hypothetical protein T552_02112 [Pneumocystis carinii B80]KTW27672.1 hypothetical protein T552_02112 [Pneumocystis carinii B80]
MKDQAKFLKGEHVDICLDQKSEFGEKDLKKSTSEWLIKDVVEKNEKEVEKCQINSTFSYEKTGFPISKKLFWKPLVKQYNESNKRLEEEYLLNEEINEENMRRISEMTHEEVIERKEELMKSLNPKLIEKLMYKKGMDKDVNDIMNKKKKVQFSFDDKDRFESVSTFNEKEKVTTSSIEVHFPTAPFDELDPSSPDFFKQLHSKYFPDLPVDPSKLAWMMAPTKDEDEMDYHESMSEIAPESIRFDFNANILSPRISREVPMYIGLHHHANAPLAAGYSIPELVHLSRSTFPAQRCIAILILGRIMYKLSKYTYGYIVTDALKNVIRKSNAMESLIDAASEKTRHLSVRSYAEEALYLSHCESNNSV